MNMTTFITFLADGALLPVIAIAGYALLFKVPKGHRYEAYVRIVMAGLTSYLFAKLLASVYQPADQRPFESLGVSAGASYLNNPGFPSDHALFASFLMCAVWFETHAKKLVGIMILFTAMVCIGRILALVHTPLDILGGLIVGAIGALWYINSRTTTHRKSPVSKSRKDIRNE
jgi:membrane-associated phospholipid phosphatase